MNKKLIIIFSSVFIVFLSLVLVNTITARDESARQSTFSNDSPFDETSFETKEVRGEEVMGVPDPPDENGPEIDTPLNDTLFEIILFLAAGALILFFRKRLLLHKE